jgi:hypothetical protein
MNLDHLVGHCVNQIDAERFDEICARFGPYAVGWDNDKLKLCLVAISNSIFLHDKLIISKQKAREIATPARQLLNALDGLQHGLGDDFMQKLRELALEGRIADRQGLGGDRRSGERSRDSQLLEAIVQLYMQAHAKPGFSKGGPLTRFVGDVCALFDVEEKSDESIRGEFNRLSRNSRHKA